MSMNPDKMIEDNMNLVYFTINKFYPTLIKDEDIIQCGMIGLWKAINTWDENVSKFANYACRCIGYEINNELKRRKRQKPTLSLEYCLYDSDDNTTSLGDLISGDSDVNYFDVQPFYESLSQKDREVFTLLYQGFTGKKIASELGISNQTAYKYIRRIRTLWGKFYGDD